MNVEKTQRRGVLYLVPVPIGNLKDITFRALDVLRSVSVIACEDSRVTRKLLQQYDIPIPMLISYNDLNERQRSDVLIQKLLAGVDVAVVGDAGTPLISDPGYHLVQKAIQKGISVVALPGPTAILPALLVSGFPPVPFVFLGFPPRKRKRRAFVQRLLQYEETVVCFESPHRIIRFLEEIIAEGAGDRMACIAREMTKVHEEYLRGTVAELRTVLMQRGELKGEFVIVLEGKDRTS